MLCPGAGPDAGFDAGLKGLGDGMPDKTPVGSGDADATLEANEPVLATLLPLCGLCAMVGISWGWPFFSDMDESMDDKLVLLPCPRCMLADETLDLLLGNSASGSGVDG